MVPQYPDAMVPQYPGAMVPRYRGIVDPWHDTVVLCYHSPLVPISPVTMVSWSCGSWHRGLLAYLGPLILWSTNSSGTMGLWHYMVF
jgi:hypothetical protein